MTRGLLGRDRSGAPRHGGASDWDDSVRILFRQAFDAVGAPDDMARKVVSMARRIEHGAKGRHAGREGWTHRVTVRAAAIAVAGTLLVGTGAYAAVSNADFFRSAFGNKGHEDIERQEVSYAEIAPEISEKADSTFVRPAMVWGEVDEAQADRLLGGYVQDVWQSVTVLGYTLTIDQLLVDANGLGLATYSLACPDGVAAQGSGYGQYYLSSDTPVGDIYLEGADEDRQVSASDGTTAWLGSPFCIHGVMDVEATTPTDLHAVAYFGPFGGELPQEGLEFKLKERKGDAVGQSIVCQPTATVPTTEFACTDGSGSTASASSLGLVLRIPAVPVDPGVPEAGMVAWNVRQIIIGMADGSEYVVMDGNDVMNYNAAYTFNDQNGGGYLFNRLIDPAQITSITVTNSAGEQIVFA